MHYIGNTVNMDRLVDFVLAKAMHLVFNRTETCSFLQDLTDLQKDLKGIKRERQKPFFARFFIHLRSFGEGHL